MEPLNRTATELVDEAIDFADELRLGVHHLENEAVVLDFGVDAPGGFEAGLLLAELRTGGLATVATRHDTLAGAPRTFVELATDHPELALLSSQRAGWRLPDGGGWASGPGQLLREGGSQPPYAPEETFDFAVLAVEADRLSDADLAGAIAAECGVSTAAVFLAVAPANSVAGATALAAGAAEVALHRLEFIGGDPSRIQSATGLAPVPPLAGDERTAVARANDAVAYGGQAHLLANGPVDAAELPFGATEHAGESFTTLIDSADGDLAALEDAFAPAAVTVDGPDGASATYGGTDPARLAEAWGR